MQTIEEYKAYTRQLENEVGQWHHAYDALIVERNALVKKILETEKTVEVNDHVTGDTLVYLLKETYESIVSELEDLRKEKF